jgi:hypothetical protein
LKLAVMRGVITDDIPEIVDPVRSAVVYVGGGQTDVEVGIGPVEIGIREEAEPEGAVDVVTAREVPRVVDAAPKVSAF